MESSGILGSPKTPVKKVTSKTRAASKDLLCLLCGMSLVGERCTFNVENHGLRDTLQRILVEKLDLTVQSCRVCRPCGRQTESLDKRFSVIRQQIGEFRSEYSLSLLFAALSQFTESASLSLLFVSMLDALFVLSQDNQCKETNKVKPIAQSSQENPPKSTIAIICPSGWSLSRFP